MILLVIPDGSANYGNRGYLPLHRRERPGNHANIDLEDTQRFRTYARFRSISWGNSNAPQGLHTVRNTCRVCAKFGKIGHVSPHLRISIVLRLGQKSE